MTEATKPKPTEFAIRATNPQTYELPCPGRHLKLKPGETIELTVTAMKLAMFKHNRFLETEIIGDNSERIAAAQVERDRRIKDSRERLDTLRKTLDERRAEEQEISDRLTVLEVEEKAAGDADRAAMMQAGRDPETTAAGVLSSTGNLTDEIKGLRFDEWGATLRRLEAEAAHADALSVVAAADAEAHRGKIKAAEEAVEKAQADLVAVRNQREGLESEQVGAKRSAQQARRRLASLESNGPERVPAA